MLAISLLLQEQPQQAAGETYLAPPYTSPIIILEIDDDEGPHVL